MPLACGTSARKKGMLEERKDEFIVIGAMGFQPQGEDGNPVRRRGR